MRNLILFGLSLLLSVAVGAQDAPVQISLSGETRAVNPVYLCINGSAGQMTEWVNSRLYDAMEELSPAAIRIPGGDIANRWDWMTGRTQEETSFARERVPLDQFAESLKAIDTVPIFVMNMVTDTLDSQLASLREADDLGLRVSYIELGHGLNTDNPAYVERFPTVADYAATAQEWATAIRTDFPDAQIAVVGSTTQPGRSQRYNTWNSQLLTALDGADFALTLQPYLDINIQRSLEPADIPALLGAPFDRFARLNEDDLAPLGERPVWITEYNITEVGQSGAVNTRWVQGLVTGTMTLLYLEAPQIEFACINTLSGDVGQSLLYIPQEIQSQAANLPSRLEAYTFSATGYIHSELGAAITGSDSAERLDFDQQPPTEGGYPALIGWQFLDRETGEAQSIVINLSAEQVPVDLTGLYERRAVVRQVYGDPRTSIYRSSDLRDRVDSVESETTLQPYSLTRIGPYEVGP
jgi:hypothetical protein